MSIPTQGTSSYGGKCQEVHKKSNPNTSFSAERASVGSEALSLATDVPAMPIATPMSAAQFVLRCHAGKDRRMSHDVLELLVTKGVEFGTRVHRLLLRGLELLADAV